MGDPACDRRFCPDCDLPVTRADDVCPECGASIDAAD